MKIDNQNKKEYNQFEFAGRRKKHGYAKAGRGDY